MEKSAGALKKKRLSGSKGIARSLSLVSSPAQPRRLDDEWQRVTRLVRWLLEDGRTTVTLEEGDLRELVSHIRDGAPARALTALVESWRDEPVSLRLATALPVASGQGDFSHRRST